MIVITACFSSAYRSLRDSFSDSAGESSCLADVRRAVSAMASSWPVRAAKGANCAARFSIGIGVRVSLTWWGRLIMSSYLLMVASYLLVAFALRGAV